MRFAKPNRSHLRGPRSGLLLTALVALAFGWTLLAASAANAQQSGSIAALVNDEIISEFDVAQRIGLVVVSSGLNRQQIQDPRLRDQVLRGLIDDTLKLQEAKRFGVTVQADELQAAKERIAQRNKTTVQSIDSILDKAGVESATFDKQIEAELAWQRLVSARYSSQVAVSQEQLDAAVEDYQRNADQPTFQVAEIFLSVDSPDQEALVKRSADALLEELRKGVAFPALASQFSQSASAQSGGNLGWVRLDQLVPQLAEAVQTLRPGEVSVPIRAPGGYYIIALVNRRAGIGARAGKPGLELRQLMVPLVANAPVDEAIDIANRLKDATANIDNCDALEGVASRIPNAKYTNLGLTSEEDLAPELRDAVAGLDVGKASRPVRTNVGFHVLTVCERTSVGASVSGDIREEIERRLESIEFNSFARRYLRNVRSDAVIDIR